VVAAGVAGALTLGRADSVAVGARAAVVPHETDTAAVGCGVGEADAVGIALDVSNVGVEPGDGEGSSTAAAAATVGVGEGPRRPMAIPRVTPPTTRTAASAIAAASVILTRREPATIPTPIVFFHQPGACPVARSGSDGSAGEPEAAGLPTASAFAGSPGAASTGSAASMSWFVGSVSIGRFPLQRSRYGITISRSRSADRRIAPIVRRYPPTHPSSAILDVPGAGDSDYCRSAVEHRGGSIGSERPRLGSGGARRLAVVGSRASRRKLA